MQLKAISLAVLTTFAYSATAHDIGLEHKHVEGGHIAGTKFVSNNDIKATLWDPRGKSEAEINKRAEYVAAFFDAGRTDEDRKQDDKIKARYKDAIVINALMPSGVGIQGVPNEKYAEAIKKNQDNQVSLISTSVWAFEGVNDVSFEDTLKRSDQVHKELGVVKVSTTKEIRQAKKDGKMAAMYNSQGADFVIEDLDKVAWAKEQGIGVMNFTYNNDNALAGGGQNPENNGVTDLGYKFIERMNKERVIIDCSHSSDQTCIDMAKHSKLPVIASHSGVYKLYEHGRNLSDEAIKAIAATDGAVCTVALGLFLNVSGTASMEDIATHVQYVGQLVGRDHTCYASDYSHMYGDFLKAFIGVVDKYPPEKGFGAPAQNAGGGDIWGVARILETKYNWKEDEIRGFLGENLMRVYKANWGK
ncbi:dipeptidase [Thalassotalea sp. HSM 43]|uniref:dipeptidase n=1 Tax=Thalassotalea sp. HSM 43 TaxID=2552945 RepID=UPI00167C07F3|nr:membrane dipeptidase [Thalassotalea sp. HSM 43]